MLIFLLLLAFTLAPILHCRDIGGARVEGHSAEGQRRYHDGAKVSRRIRQRSWARGFITVGSVKVPAYLASQIPVARHGQRRRLDRRAQCRGGSVCP